MFIRSRDQLFHGIEWVANIRWKLRFQPRRFKMTIPLFARAFKRFSFVSHDISTLCWTQNGEMNEIGLWDRLFLVQQPLFIYSFSLPPFVFFLFRAPNILRSLLNFQIRCVSPHSSLLLPFSNHVPSSTRIPRKYLFSPLFLFLTLAHTHTRTHKVLTVGTMNLYALSLLLLRGRTGSSAFKDLQDRDAAIYASASKLHVCTIN